jgi:hypothetical protein
VDIPNRDLRGELKSLAMSTVSGRTSVSLKDDRVQASDIIAVRARSKAETPRTVGPVDDVAAAIGGITYSLPA